jgi:formamidopyrimidine-DNA glycosylase
VQAVDRRGKWLRLRFDDGTALYSHLGMSGKWVRRPALAPPEAHELVKLALGDTSVRYLDPRRFGRLTRVAPEAVLPEWEALGPDPLTDGINPDRLHSTLSRSRRPLKVALLDQALLAGIGNIQACEALWLARLSPWQRADTLSLPESRALSTGLRRTLDDTLAQAEESGDELTYLSESAAHNPFRVYDRKGAPCRRCHTAIERTPQGGRSTFHCPHCQPVPPRCS